MNIHDYLIDHGDLDWVTLLEEWRWLLPPAFKVWLFTRTGDLFLTLPDESIHMLDVGAGELRKVAANRDEACIKIDEPGIANDWLMIPIVDYLVSTGHILHDGECYGFKLLPVLGGTYKPDNRPVIPIHEHFGLWGSVHHKISKLPDGSQVEIKFVP